MFAGKSAVDVGEAGADAVLVPFEGVEVDGVGEVCREEFVALVLESFAVLGQFGEFLGAGCETFVERGLDLCRERGVLLLGERDVSVAVADPGPGICSPFSSTLSPGIALAYYSVFAAVALVVAIIITRRRDA